MPWLGSSDGYSIFPMSQSCGFNLQSGLIQESISKCINKQNEKLILSLSASSLSAYLSLKSINNFLKYVHHYDLY